MAEKVLKETKAAAFGRLCVETDVGTFGENKMSQPPSGGCVLKLNEDGYWLAESDQPPSGGCVLKHSEEHEHI